MNVPLIFLAFTVGTAIIGYIVSRDDSNQKNRIENLGRINNDLTKEVEKLSHLNTDIAMQNSVLAVENNKLANKANELVEEVKKLTAASNELIRRVDLRTEEQSALTALSGIIDFDNDKPLMDEEMLNLHLGNNKLGNPVSDYKKENRPVLLNLTDGDFVPIKIVDGKLKFSVKIYDLGGNWIANISDNYWIRNPNNTGLFNYDAHGFEVIDNGGFVALSVNIVSRTDIEMQGYLVDRVAARIILFGENGMMTLNLPITFVQANATIKKVGIKPIFRYSGPNWLGARN